MRERIGSDNLINMIIGYHAGTGMWLCRLLLTRGHSTSTVPLHLRSVSQCMSARRVRDEASRMNDWPRRHGSQGNMQQDDDQQASQTAFSFRHVARTPVNTTRNIIDTLATYLQ